MNSYGKYSKYLITVQCTDEMEVCTRGQKTVLMHFHLVSLHFFTVFPLPGVSLFISAVDVLFILKDPSLYYSLHQVSLSSLIWSQPFPFLKASGTFLFILFCFGWCYCYLCLCFKMLDSKLNLVTVASSKVFCMW